MPAPEVKEVTAEEAQALFVESVMTFRKEIDANIQKAESFMGNASPNGQNCGREMALVRTKLQEAKMWAGKVLEAVGNPFPPELADKAE
jgi:hypothetical protein